MSLNKAQLTVLLLLTVLRFIDPERVEIIFDAIPYLFLLIAELKKSNI